MDLALHFPCVYPLIQQSFRRANHLPFRDVPSSGFGQSCSMGRSKKGSVCCTKPSDEGSSSPSGSKQEEIISLFRRIQASISNGESRGAGEEKNRDGSSEREPLSKAILDVLEKPRKKTDGYTGVKTEPPKRQGNVARPPSSFAKRSPIRPFTSGPTGKLSVTESDNGLEVTEKEEKPPLILETMKLAELKEVAKNRGLKGYSRLKKSEILELLRSSRF